MMPHGLRRNLGSESGQKRHLYKQAFGTNRTFSRYIQLLLAAGLQLVYFDEPTPIGGEATKAERYRRSPYFHIMELQKT
jgi:hypothetical protein